MTIQPELIALLAEERSTDSSKTARNRVPSTLPAKAATNQSQPCKLPDAMPLK